MGQKKSRKIPSKFPTKFSKFPCEKSKKNHRRASAGAQGEGFQGLWPLNLSVYDSAKVFVSQERVSGFPEKAADLQGSPGNVAGGSGKLQGNLWIAVKFHSERTSGEVAGKLPGKSPGNFRGSRRGTSGEVAAELPGKSPGNFRGSLGNFRGSPGTFQRSLGEPDSLPPTRQNDLQMINRYGRTARSLYGQRFHIGQPGLQRPLLRQGYHE